MSLICGADVEPESISWLWEPHYARGKVHLLAGHPSAGKSTITLNHAAIISIGGKWPDGTQAPLGDVLLWSSEDDFADTILPRFLAAGGDRSRLHFIAGMKDENGKAIPFDPATDVPALCEAAEQLPDLQMFILDPVSVIVGTGKGASHNDAEVRRALQPLLDMVRKRNIAGVGIIHLTKVSERRILLEQINGSGAFGAVARVVHFAATFKDPAKAALWVRAKCNIAQQPDRGFEYRTRSVPVIVAGEGGIYAPKLEWIREVVGNAQALLAEDKDDSVQKAKIWLKDLLIHHGSMATKEIKAAAEAHGHAWREDFGAHIDPRQVLGGSHAGWSWHWVDEPQKASS